MNTSLSSFLSRVRSTVFNAGSASKLTVVLGNSSADLDSFVSAVVLSYFHTTQARSNGNTEDRLFVPLLNLPSVPSSDLWRLRPEYGTALRLATQKKKLDDEKDGPSKDAHQEKEKNLLKQLITISDLQASPSSQLHALFVEEPSSSPQEKIDTILVDHNAPAISGFSSTTLSARLTLTGVIDHHVEESAVPASASPRIVTTGIGSCTSLVVRHLREAELWPPSASPGSGSGSTSGSGSPFTELAKLALAPILIDTANLTATGDKISEVDRAAVSFLESHIHAEESGWDRKMFYQAIQSAKSNSLDRLSMWEVFERDYKEWTETPSASTEKLTIGIASLVREIPWLVNHAGSVGSFISSIHDFARSKEHNLSLFVLLTKGNAPEDGAFRKELAVVAYGAVAERAVERFEGAGGGELGLKGWDRDGDFLREMGKEKGISICKVWWQGDVSKSRKQVAPLMREAVRRA